MRSITKFTRIELIIIVVIINLVAVVVIQVTEDNSGEQVEKNSTTSIATDTRENW